MEKEEIYYIKNKLINLKPKPSKHLKEKIDSFNKLDFEKELKAIENIEIIEYNETLSDNGFLDYRALLRTNNTYEVEIDKNKEICQLCFVISIKTGIIVTAYWNQDKDNHRTLDLKRYNKNIKIIKSS